jgi:hypothetical protein
MYRNLDEIKKTELKAEFLKAHVHWRRHFDEDISNIFVKKSLGAWLIQNNKLS